MAAPSPDETGIGAWQALIAFGMLMINFAGAIVGGTWVLGRSREKLVEKIDTAKAELDRRLTDETNQTLNRFGETVSAMRQKMTEMELWNRDNFVNKVTFQVVIQQFRDSWQRLEDKIDKRFDRIDEKLEGGGGGK